MHAVQGHSLLRLALSFSALTDELLDSGQAVRLGEAVTRQRTEEYHTDGSATVKGRGTGARLGKIYELCQNKCRKKQACVEQQNRAPTELAGRRLCNAQSACSPVSYHSERRWLVFSSKMTLLQDCHGIICVSQPFVQRS